MNKEKLQQDIEEMKAKLAEMETELGDKLELKKGSYLPTLSGDIALDDRWWDDDAVQCGATRATKELAEIASKNMLARNRLEAWVHQYQKDDVGDYIIYLDDDNKYDKSPDNMPIIGAVHMKRDTAEWICDKLNNKRITL